MTDSIKPCIKCGTKPILIHSHTFAYWCCPNCGNHAEPEVNKELSPSQLYDHYQFGVEPFFYNKYAFDIDFDWNWANTPEEKLDEWCEENNLIVLFPEEEENLENEEM